MFDGRIFRCMTLEFHKAHLQLQGSIGQQADKVRLSGNLQRHQVEDDNLQGTDILHVCTGIVHHKDVFVFQQLNGW